MILSSSFCVIIFLNLPLFSAATELYETPNVKTALFTEMDLRRSCWNADDTNLLKTRMIMQDLIPKKVPRDMAYLVEYIRSTEEAVVLHSPEGKIRRIMMLAFSDVMGAYLQAVAIPMAKEAYYAGNIDYATMSRLYEHMNEMKTRLRTDGGRWSRPVDMSKFSVKVTALHLPMENAELACKALFVIPKESCLPGMSRIAIPYLDYDVKPGAVALPLKSRNLYSLKTSASSHIIVRFYMLARQCLSEMPVSDTQIFNFQFIKWLSTKVVPHLQGDVWYPGFGSVMRIVETVNDTETYNDMKKSYFKADDTSLEKSLIGMSCGLVQDVKDMAKYNPWWFVLLIIILLLCLLFCLGSLCCMCRGGHRDFFTRRKNSGIVNAVLSIYCGFKDKEDAKDARGPPPQYRRLSQPRRTSDVPSQTVYQTSVQQQQQQPQQQHFNRETSSSDEETTITSDEDDEETESTK